MRNGNESGGFAAIDEEVAAVLAFVISSATFLAAPDDETGRCPKVVFKSTGRSAHLIPLSVKFYSVGKFFQKQ